MSHSLLKSVSLVSAMTFISRILGFIRDLIAAQLFGVNASVDAFYIAFKIPNFMRNLFAEGSFSQAFIPVLSDYRNKKSTRSVRFFIGHIAGSLGFILCVITILGLLGAKPLVSLFSPGLDPYRFELATDMLRITFPYLMLISLTAFAGAVLNCYGKFGIPAFTPALLNITLILTAFGMMHWFAVPVKSQAFGVLIAGVVQLLFQLIAVYRMGFLVRPRIAWHDPGVRRVLKLIIPALFGASVGQISILLNTVLASFLITGSISWLYYSERLAYFPLGIFGVALATVILPHLSRQHSAGSQDGFSMALDWGLRWNLIIGLPASLTMWILSGPLIVSLFQYGQFNVHDVLMTQRATIAYSLGLQAFMLAKILSSAFYAQQDIRTPVKISVVTLGINIVFSILLVIPFAHAGLALASSLSSWANVIVLWGLLYKRRIITGPMDWVSFMVRLFFSNAILALFLWYGTDDLMTWVDWRWPARLMHLACLGFGSIILYVLCLTVTRGWPRKLNVYAK